MWKQIITLFSVISVGLVALVARDPGAGALQIASIDLDPATADIGDRVVVTGAGWGPGDITIHLDSVAPGGQLAATVADAGEFVVRFVVPDVAPGQHLVLACRDMTRNGDCREMARAVLTIPTPREPTATPTPTPSPTPTPPPLVAQPTATPTVTPPPLVAQPTATPTATPDPGPDEAVVPTATPTPAVAQIVTPTPLPTEAPGLAAPVTVVPEPTFDPNPGQLAGAPTATPQPSFQNPGGGFDGDLFVRAIEVTQGVQNMDSLMPLVEHRATWVRVYPGVAGGETVELVNGAMLLERDGMAATVINPVNADIVAGGQLDRTDIDASLNFELDPEWLTGDVKLTAAVWHLVPDTIEDEPWPDNNQRVQWARFKEITEPSLLLVPVNDGAGPGPDHTLISVLEAYLKVVTSITDFAPIGNPDITLYPGVIEPGPFANVSPGSYDLTTGEGRHEPNRRLAWLEGALGIGGPAEGATQIMGLFDLSIPSGGFSGWASEGATWSKPTSSTPAHEYAHNRGLAHVGCRDNNTYDDDGDVVGGPDGIPDELRGGGLDPSHPNAFPNCSLAPIDPEGYFGFTTYRDPIEVFSNDPVHPSAAFPLMSYESPKWNDAYHWCRLISAHGAPCDPAAIGVPPAFVPDPSVVVDCTPEVSGGIQLGLCVQAEPGAPQSDAPSVDQAAFVLPVPEPTQTTAGWKLEDVIVSSYGGSGAVSSDSGTHQDWIDVMSFGPAIHEYVPPERPHYYTWELEDLLVSNMSPGEPGSVPPVVLGFADRLQGLLDGTIAASQHKLRIEDAAGNPLVIWPLSGADEASEDRPFAGSVDTVPWPAGGHRVVILDGDRVVDERTRSEHAPTVGTVQTRLEGQQLWVGWSGDDLDGDPLTYALSWSADGETFLPLGSPTDATEFTVDDVSLFPGGDVVVRVVAHDGMRTGGGLSASMPVPDRPPVGAILEPADGAVFDRDRRVDFRALAQDPEHGLLSDDAVQWTSSLDGAIGTGRWFATSELSPGEHVIAMTASTPTGDATRAEIRVVVRDTAWTKVIDEVSEPLATALGVSIGEPVPAADGGSAPAVGSPVSDDDGGGLGLVAVGAIAAAALAAGFAVAVALRRRK